MIRIRLRDQLGNQMFQYATARALAERRGTGLCVDVRGYARGGNWSKYQLWRFPRLGLGTFVRQAARSFECSAQKRHSGTVTFEMKGLGFAPAVNDLPADATLQGFFTSERYFLDHRDLIVSLLSLNDFLRSEDTAALGSRFPNRTPVALHVRRSDYVGNPLFDIGDLDAYYRTCIAWISEQVADAYFVIFSDDPQWCRHWQLLDKIDAVVIEPNRVPHHDMALMAWCVHHIIANSTFSWWAAWLASNPRKRVMMPRRWLDRWSTKECGLSVPGWLEIEPGANCIEVMAASR